MITRQQEKFKKMKTSHEISAEAQPSSNSVPKHPTLNPHSNSKLAIVNSYDKLINLVDIRAEEILEKHVESDLFDDVVVSNADNKPQQQMKNKSKNQDIFDKLGEDMLVDQNKEEYEIDEKFKKPHDIDLKTTTVFDYVNKMRIEVIDTLKKEQDEALRMYDKRMRATNDVDSNNQEKLELIGNKYCFLIEPKTKKETDIKPSRYVRSPFSIYLFVLDFCLDERTRNNLT